MRMSDNILVHSFEPIPETYAQLEENLKINNANCHSKVNNIALGNEQSSAIMHFPEFSGSAAASMKKTHPNEKNSLIDVTVDTLDNYGLVNKIRKVDLIKIDVEGSELSVLEGGYNFLKEHEGKEVKFKLSSRSRGADKKYFFTHYEHTLPVSDLKIIGGVLGEDKKGK